MCLFVAYFWVQLLDFTLKPQSMTSIFSTAFGIPLIITQSILLIFITGILDPKIRPPRFDK